MTCRLRPEHSQSTFKNWCGLNGSSSFFPFLLLLLHFTLESFCSGKVSLLWSTGFKCCKFWQSPDTFFSYSDKVEKKKNREKSRRKNNFVLFWTVRVLLHASTIFLGKLLIHNFKVSKSSRKIITSLAIRANKVHYDQSGFLRLIGDSVIFKRLFE